MRTSYRRRDGFKQPSAGKGAYSVGAESLTVADKMKVLESLGQPELIELFKEWQPRQQRRRRAGAPLDQRLAITVTDEEKVYLERELKAVKASGGRASASAFVRNRAMGSVDIYGWKEIAVSALARIEKDLAAAPELRKRQAQLAALIEEADDAEDEAMYDKEMNENAARLNSLVARPVNRRNRLTGRMTMVEAETVKWRASRLSISSSDYLRMLIFGLEPDSSADSHMSLDAKRRFYVSIIEVADNGWGDVPSVYQCSQCASYVEEIDKLRERIAQLETFI